MRSKKSIFNEFGAGSIFEFTTPDYTYIIIAYPVWRAFISYGESGVWIEVKPLINVENEKIFFPAEAAISVENHGVAIRGKYIKEAVEPEKQKLFFAAIPEEVKKQVSVFKDSHWEIIKAIITFGDIFTDFMKSNPTLTHIMICLEKINPSFSLYKDHSYIRHLILRKKKEILGLAGLPETERMVKMLTKIDPGMMGYREVLGLVNISTHNGSLERVEKLIAHSRIINKNMFNLILAESNLLKIVGNRFVFELIKDDKYREKIEDLRKIYRLVTKWNIKIDSINEYGKLQSALEKVEKLALELETKKNLPLPPLEDNDHIKAIRSEKEHSSWAIRQQNCIRKYLPDIRKGKYVFYKINYLGEEATLEIKINNGKYRMGDLRGFRNERVSPRLREEVKQWIKNSPRLKLEI